MIQGPGAGHGAGGAHVRHLRRPQHHRSQWATWPNAVTLLRLLLTVPLCGQILTAAGGAAPLARAVVLVVLVLWAGSDWVDGFLARRWNQRSRVGEVLDPVADRLGILAVGACLAVIGQVPWWIVTVIVMTDVVVTLLAGRAAGRGDLSVSVLGKVRTAVLVSGLCLVLTGVLFQPAIADVGRAVLVFAAVLHVLAGADYVRRAAHDPTHLPRPVRTP